MQKFRFPPFIGGKPSQVAHIKEWDDQYVAVELKDHRIIKIPKDEKPAPTKGAMYVEYGHTDASTYPYHIFLPEEIYDALIWSAPETSVRGTQ